MNRSEVKKMQLLGIMVGLLCLSLYYNSRGSLTPGPDVRPPVKTMKEEPKPRGVKEELPSIALLQKEAPIFLDSSRNLFEFSGDGAVPPDPELVAEEKQATEQTAPEPAPGSDITFIGFYREKSEAGKDQAAVSIGGRIYVARVGEIVAGRCRILRIEEEALVVSLIPDNAMLRYSLGRNNGAPVVLSNALK